MTTTKNANMATAVVRIRASTVHEVRKLANKERRSITEQLESLIWAGMKANRA